MPETWKRHRIVSASSADPCVIPRDLLVKIDFIVLSGRFGCQ